MDQIKLSKLQRAVRRVVQTASEPGGAIDRVEFTLATARAEVTELMGLPEGALDGQWKKSVKEEVNKALDALNDAAGEGSEASSSTVASPSPPPPKKSRIKPPSASRRPPTPSPTPEPTPEPPVIEVNDDSAAESEMSSVYDAPPKARGKKRKSEESHPVKKERRASSSSAAKGGKGKKPKGKKDPNEGLSPEEAKVADLKRIVVACGVRKQWSKEFERADTAYAQKIILQEMLKGLGMDGKPTLAKAKVIKEARELASELNDVKEFEAARGRSAAERPRRGVSARQREDDDEPEEQGAAAAVMSFLDDAQDNDSD